MNDMGIYTAVIGILVIIIIGGTLMYLHAPKAETDAAAVARTVREVKMYWEDARVVLDKGTALVLLDAASKKLNVKGDICDNFESKCVSSVFGLSGGATEQNIDEFFNSTTGSIYDKTGVYCTAVGDLEGQGPGYEIKHVKISCVKILAPGLHSVSFNTSSGNQLPPVELLFQKELSATVIEPPTGGTEKRCRISVTDSQSGQEEPPDETNYCTQPPQP